MLMGHFTPGIGVLAQSLNLPVVPVKLEGLSELKRRQQYFADPGMVRVVVGQPLRFDRESSPAFIAQELERRFNED